MAAKQTELHLRIMTYNVSGASRRFSSSVKNIAHIIKEEKPDILFLQEAIQEQDADGHWYGTVSSILETLKEISGCTYKHHFGDTLSMKSGMDVRKPVFINSIFQDRQDWQQGNAILSREGFTSFRDPMLEGPPKNIPLYRFPLYEGNRNTEDRYALMARINHPPVFPYVMGVHLTTLVAERTEPIFSTFSKTEKANLSKAAHSIVNMLKKPFIQAKARNLRYAQSQRIVALLREHVLDANEVIFLLGDLNADADEACISSVLGKEGGFTRLIPQNDVPTHLFAENAIDHILFYPRHRLLDYKCHVVESIHDKDAREISDHLPVVADVVIKAEN